ncbi:hypothetical protein MSAN_00732000 [Mycena sanguinolenta]|uniref:Uncharacterized protein n=1 Tax=Mycena sanguinolenta TaxID=230812 RepID=A0A8H7DG52_9AGAR|nr:hypothetical protein MSAN_00732000 [Mycena sanguinolenta]
MTTTIPLGALATALEDNDAPLRRKYLFRKDYNIHHQMEYLWGMDIDALDSTHERSILYVRSSMLDSTLPWPLYMWILIPTQETLVAMLDLQIHNISVPISERKSFLTEFSAQEYEYIFFPLRPANYFILLPGQDPRRFSAPLPYADFPRVTSSANPFFVTFDSQMMLMIHHFNLPKTYWEIFAAVTEHWSHKNTAGLPDDFLFSYPEMHLSEFGSDDENEPDALIVDPESKSGDDETPVPPVDEEDLLLVPDKEAFMYDWAQFQSDARPVFEPPRLARRDFPVCNPSPPMVEGEPTREVIESVQNVPQWCIESKRGRDQSARLFTSPL